MKRIKGSPDLRRQLAAEGMTTKDAAARLGISPSALTAWSKKYNVRFRDGRQRHAPSFCVIRQGPLSRQWLLARLTESELADFRTLRGPGQYTALEALAVMRRADLVAEVEAHLTSKEPRND